MPTPAELCTGRCCLLINNDASGSSGASSLSRPLWLHPVQLKVESRPAGLDFSVEGLLCMCLSFPSKRIVFSFTEISSVNTKGKCSRGKCLLFRLITTLPTSFWQAKVAPSLLLTESLPGRTFDLCGCDNAAKIPVRFISPLGLAGHPFAFLIVYSVTHQNKSYGAAVGATRLPVTDLGDYLSLKKSNGEKLRAEKGRGRRL